VNPLGPYELEKEIGRGGAGRVYRAKHLPTGAVRAVKILDAGLDLESLERFRREARALASAGGAGVVPVHESGVEGRTSWYAMELMPGGSLRAKLVARGRLPWREASALVLELARTLGPCHEKGLVHRDLKPDNVLFDEEGRARLADWGCVRDLGASRLTRSNAVLGTPAYMAPEQLEDARVDARADVFSLGVILHELVTGKRPFDARSASDIYLKIKRAERPSTAGSGAPAELDALLDRLLRVDPASRHANAGEVARDLEALLAGARIARPRPRGGRMRDAVIAFATVSSLVLLGLVAVRREAPPRPAEPAPVAHHVASIETMTRIETAKSAKQRIPAADLAWLADSNPAEAGSLALTFGIEGAEIPSKTRELWKTHAPLPLARALVSVDRLGDLLESAEGCDSLAAALRGAFGSEDAKKLWATLTASEELARTCPALVAPIASSLEVLARDAFRDEHLTGIGRPQLIIKKLASLFAEAHGLSPVLEAVEVSNRKESGRDDFLAVAERLKDSDPLLRADLRARGIKRGQDEGIPLGNLLPLADEDERTLRALAPSLTGAERTWAMALIHDILALQVVASRDEERFEPWKRLIAFARQEQLPWLETKDTNLLVKWLAARHAWSDVDLWARHPLAADMPAIDSAHARTLADQGKKEEALALLESARKHLNFLDSDMENLIRDAEEYVKTH